MAKGSKKKSPKKSSSKKPLVVSVHGDKIDLELTLQPHALDAGDGLDEIFEKIGAMIGRSGAMPASGSIDMGRAPTGAWVPTGGIKLGSQIPDEPEDVYHDRISMVIERFAEGMCDHMLERGLEIIAAEKTKRAMQVS